MASASKVQRFLDEVQARSSRKRPAPSSSSTNGGKPALFMPVQLHVDTGHREAREQLLWKLGDGSKVPASVARAFCQQHVQNPQQLEREALRLQKDLEKLLERHRDLLNAPSSTTLVRLEVGVKLAHLENVYLDEPVWDLAAPRNACEAYVSAVCNELGLDWQAHALITRRMKDAVDAAAKDLAAGKARVLTIPSGADVVRSPPGRSPQVIRMAAAQAQQMRAQLAAAQAAKAKQRGEGQQQQQPQQQQPQQQQPPLSPGGLPSPGLPSPGMAAAVAQAAHHVKSEPAKAAKQPGPAAAVAAAAVAAGAAGAAAPEPAGPASDGPLLVEQPSGEDMPDLPV